MTNKELSKAFKLTAQLLELHDENPFKIKSLQNAAFKLERFPSPVENLSTEELAAIDGIGKSTQAKIGELLQRQSFLELDEMLAKTPEGVISMLSIKGIGPKKVRVLWKELGLESVGELLYACNENRLVELKGFGEKTQQQIKHAIEYAESNQGKFHYSFVEPIALQLEKDILHSGLVSDCSITGSVRRKSEIIETLQLVVAIDNSSAFKEFLSSHPLVDAGSVSENKMELNGVVAGKLPLSILLSSADDFSKSLFNSTGSEAHLQHLRNNHGYDGEHTVESEASIYKSLHLPYFEPELREGLHEFGLLKENKLPELIRTQDLRGILHNHTTYSDGAHTLSEMANYCKELGYEYVGICDHSKSAFYANGLQPERILAQHKEIDALNAKLAPFRIFKGIESDILVDGSLDYPEDVLSSFDFIVASVHSVLRMDRDKATQRLIKAIENPYTTILGHPTGRLLLAREGYPIDHHKIIDACAANGVILELNANPYRLDIDWRYIPYALNKNVKISINPDAHRMEGYHDMYYGVCVARKGGLTKEMTFNSLPGDEMQKYFETRKNRR